MHIYYRFFRNKVLHFTLTFIIGFYTFNALAVIKVKVGQGAGILWEGMPFDKDLKIYLFKDNTAARAMYPLIGIDSSNSCSSQGGSQYDLTGLIPEGSQGIRLVPRASFSSTFRTGNYQTHTVTGTLGINGTRGTNGGTNENLVANPINKWCIPATMGSIENYFDTGTRSVHITGNWVLIGDGTQRSGTFKIPKMFALSRVPGFNSLTDATKPVTEDEIELIVNQINCQIQGPQTINFGDVIRNTKKHVELGSSESQFNIQCNQNPQELAEASVSLRFRSISGYFEGDKSKLNLNQQGGGYITGTKPNSNVNGGECGTSTGINFDSTPYDIGKITSTDQNKSFNSTIKWRLCSGGEKLPSGPVSASAEMIVTLK